MSASAAVELAVERLTIRFGGLTAVDEHHLRGAGAARCSR